MPTWGLPNDPFYRVRPVLHEPGPINMSLVTSKTGFPVAAGQRLKLTVNYDDQYPHTRVMGIMGLYITPDPSVAGCMALPSDAHIQRAAPRPGRSIAPRVRVPINAVGPTGIASPIAAPPGQPVLMPGGGPLDIADFSFEPTNVVVRPGAVLRWTVWGPTLHNVTLANGPQGFASANLSDGRSFAARLSLGEAHDFGAGNVAKFAEIVDQKTQAALVFVRRLHRFEKIGNQVFEFGLFDFKRHRQSAFD